MKVGLIGDLHFRESLAYADLIKDRRMQEKKDVLDTIVEAFEDHDLVVFMGDNLNTQNNLSSVVDDFMKFLSRFDGKEVLILAGNHEKFGDGRSAIDFLKRVKGKRWTVVTNRDDIRLFDINGLKVLPFPFLTNPELGVKSYKDGHAVLNEIVESFTGDLFVGHHALDMDFMAKYEEPLFTPNSLWDRFAVTAIGHVHEPKIIHGTLKEAEVGFSTSKNYFDFIRTGSSFTSSVGELERNAWSVNFGAEPEMPYIEPVRLPVRSIISMKNPDKRMIEATQDINGHYAIVKAEVTDRAIDAEWLKKELEMRFDGKMVIERYETEREKTQEDLRELTIEQMLEIYAEAKKRSKEIYLRGFELIQ